MIIANPSQFIVNRRPVPGGQVIQASVLIKPMRDAYKHQALQGNVHSFGWGQCLRFPEVETDVAGLESDLQHQAGRRDADCRERAQSEEAASKPTSAADITGPTLVMADIVLVISWSCAAFHCRFLA
jgi:hypothetical protein